MNVYREGKMPRRIKTGRPENCSREQEREDNWSYQVTLLLHLRHFIEHQRPFFNRGLCYVMQKWVRKKSDGPTDERFIIIKPMSSTITLLFTVIPPFSLSNLAILIISPLESWSSLSILIRKLSTATMTYMIMSLLFSMKIYSHTTNYSIKWATTTINSIDERQETVYCYIDIVYKAREEAAVV